MSNSRKLNTRYLLPSKNRTEAGFPGEISESIVLGRNRELQEVVLVIATLAETLLPSKNPFSRMSESVTPASPTLPTPFLQVEGLSVAYGKGRNRFLALQDVSCFAMPGEVLGVVGESGSGKSTLSRCIMSLVPAVEGRIYIDNVDHATLSSGQLRMVRSSKQMVFQDPYASLNPRMTIFSALQEALECRTGKLPSKAQEGEVAALMAKVGLDPRAMLKYPHEFSGGQRQRIAIARALAPDPQLLVADEPVSALDVSIQGQILNLLADLRQEMGLTMVFVSHDLHVVRHLADRVVVMQHGMVVESGLVAAVMEDPQEAYTKQLLAATPKLKRD